MRKFIRLTFIVAVNLAVLAALLVAMEWGFRHFEQRDKKPWGIAGLGMVEPHPTRVWWYKPNFQGSFESKEFTMDIRTNSRRLRSAESTQGDLTVLAIGDSFTFGWGVSEDQRYSEQLGKLLEQQLGAQRVAVINAGHWMYTFDQQLLILAELVDEHRPDLVVQGWYWPHARTILGHEWVERGDVVVEVEAPGVFVDGESVLRFRHDFLTAPPLGSRLLAEFARSWLNYKLVGESSTSDLDLLDEQNPDARVAWERTEEMVRQTGTLVERLGVPYLAFGVPRDALVSESEWTPAYRETLNGKDLDLPDKKFADWFAQAGLDYVDLTATFRKNYSAALYFETDPHWAAGGHALAAATLLEPALKKLASN